jgi:hypothetical protein
MPNPGAHIMTVALRQPTSASLLLLLLAGCRYFDAGVDRALAPAADGPTAPAADAGGPGDAPADQLRLDSKPPSPEPPEPPNGAFKGEPSEIGCADGTREGFADPAAWINIAGCSGAWSIPGVRGPQASQPRCARAAGNTGSAAGGIGCAAADLCADGWHVCLDGEDVRRKSPTECESAIHRDHTAFFVTQAGASAYGLCAADPSLQNDLHGCGNFGQPELGGCQSLNRRLSFVDCLASRVQVDGSPVWSCGDATRHLSESSLVTKSSSALGGVLCCRDP